MNQTAESMFMEPGDPGPFQYIEYHLADGVATVTMNRPEAYNSYNTPMLEEMRQAFRHAAWDDRVGVLVLTGAGEKAFCTGGDVKEYAGTFTQSPHQYWKYMSLFTECHDALRNIGIPTIARLNGIVAGGGNEFNMACDLAVAADDITIRQVGTKVGSVAAGGATQWLPIMVGDRRAREILFLSEPMSAQKAVDWGLINKAVPRDQLDAEVADLAKKLIEKFPECMRYTKESVNFWKNLAWDATINHAKEWLALHFATLEPYEGMTAFVEKRSPAYDDVRKRMLDGRGSESVWGPPAHTCPKCGAKGLPKASAFCHQCGESLA